MKKENSLLIFLIILVILSIILGAVFYFEIRTFSSNEERVGNFDKQREYNVVQIICKDDKIISEYFAVTTKNNIVLDTRIVETGYTEEMLEEKYNLLNEFNMLIYNVAKKDSTITYNTTINNGKSVYELIENRKNNSAEVVVKGI